MKKTSLLLPLFVLSLLWFTAAAAGEVADRIVAEVSRLQQSSIEIASYA